MTSSNLWNIVVQISLQALLRLKSKFASGGQIVSLASVNGNLSSRLTLAFLFERNISNLNIALACRR